MTLSIEPIKASHIECNELLQSPEIVFYVVSGTMAVGRIKTLILKSDTATY